MKRADVIPLEVTPELYERVLAQAGGLHVKARMLFEHALLQLIRAERERIESAHRAEVSRQRRRFGWVW